MSNQKQVIIHSGFHKTASSSIQHTLGDNRKRLEKFGYYYPDLIVGKQHFYNQSIPLYGLFTEHPEEFLHYTRHNNFDPVHINQQINDVLDNDIINRNQVLFSDEFISSLSKAALTKLKNRFELMGFNIRVITFVRDPYNLVTSQIQQRIPKDHIQNLLDELSTLNQSYLKIKTLEAVFGSAVEFHCFEKACQYSGGPVAYFLNLLSISERNSINLKTVNESRSNQAVRLISYIKKNSESQTQKRSDTFPLFAIKGEKFVLTSQEFSQIENTVFKERNKISTLLGDDFFMPVNYSTNDRVMTWNKEQISTVTSIIPELKEYIAILVYQYFYQLHSQGNFITNEQLNKMAHRIVNIFPGAINDINFPTEPYLQKVSKFKKVVLHVGPDKTGSTSIQFSFDKYRELLLKHGVFYPVGAGVNKTRHHVLGSCVTSESDLFIFNEGFNREQHLQEILQRDQEYLAFLKDCFSKTKMQADTLVLSCEGFAHLTEEAFERMKTFLEEYCDAIEVVLYARPPLSYAASALSQRVKRGEGTFDSYFFPAFPFQEVLEKLIRVFGKKNINLRLFTKKTFPKGNVVLDFLSLLNLPTAVKEQVVSTTPPQNPSLSEEAIMIGNRMIELLDGYIPAGKAFRLDSGIGIKFLPRIKGQKFELSNLQKAGVLKQSMSHIEYLTREFGITLKDEKRPSYSLEKIPEEAVDFAARALINILVPDFDLLTGTKRTQNVVGDKRRKRKRDKGKNLPLRKKESKFKKIILHVGPDKTGSTSIQSALHQSRELLIENNVFYPVGAGRRHHILGSYFTPESELFTYNKSYNREQHLQKILNRDKEYFLSLKKAFVETQADIAILSCEGFVHLAESTFEQMKQFIEQYCDEIEVVLYTRAPLAYAASAMSQRVKTGERVWEGMHIPVQPYQDFVEKLSRVFGKNKINIRPFSKEFLPNGDVVLDFLTLLDLPKSVEDQILMMPASHNYSLSEEALVIGDRMIELLDGYIPLGEEFRTKRNIGNGFLPLIKGRKIQLTDFQQKIILKLAAPHTDYLAREFGITLKDRECEPYKPLEISAETIDFTARVLLNVLVPDFELSISDKKKRKWDIYPKSAWRLKFNTKIRYYSRFAVLKLKPFLNSHPGLRTRIKLILSRLGILG